MAVIENAILPLAHLQFAKTQFTLLLFTVT